MTSLPVYSLPPATTSVLPQTLKMLVIVERYELKSRHAFKVIGKLVFRVNHRLVIFNFVTVAPVND